MSLREDVIAPGKYPQEFREDVVAVARGREPGVTLSQIAKDFGISDQTLIIWLKQADVEEGRGPGQTKDDAAEVRELRRRNRLWHWRNGFPAGFPHGLKHGQLQLDDAVGFYRRASLGTSIDQWNPEWFRIAGTGNAGDAMCCAEVSGSPLVRAVSTFDLGTQAYEEPLRQVV